jgi:predicted dehydrogenase
MDILKVGIIGVGKMGERHGIVYKSIPCAEVVALADTCGERSQEVSKDLGISEVYTDYSDLLNNNLIQAVSICTPDSLHKGPAVAAAEKGKHLLIEKPLATNLEDAQQILDAAKANNVKVMVGYTVRFMSPFTLLKEEITKIGEVVFVNVNWYNAASIIDGVITPPVTKDSIITFLATHPIDFVRWLFGDISRVYCEAGYFSGNKKHDAASISLRLKTGAIGTIICNWATTGAAHPTKFSIDIIGKTGQISSSSLDGRLTVSSMDKGFEYPIGYDWKPMVTEELTYFCHCVLDSKEPMINGKEGLKSLEATLAAQKSADTGEVVNL